jgi:hypothetical protein
MKAKLHGTTIPGGRGLSQEGYEVQQLVSTGKFDREDKPSNKIWTRKKKNTDAYSYGVMVRNVGEQHDV